MAPTKLPRKKRTLENEILTAMRFMNPKGGNIENALSQLAGHHHGLNVCLCDDCEDARRSLPQTVFPDKGSCPACGRKKKE